MDCHVLKTLPEFAQLTNLRYTRESHFHEEQYSIAGSSSVTSDDYHQQRHTKETENEVYPDDGLELSNSSFSSSARRNPLLWGDDILFLDPPRESDRSHQHDQQEEDSKMALMHINGQESDCSNKIEFTSHVVTMSDLTDMGLDPEKYGMTLPEYHYLPKDEVVDADDLETGNPLGNICSSLNLSDIEQSCTLEEVQQPESPEIDEPRSVQTGRPGLRRTRNASRRFSVITDDASFGSGEGRRRHRNSSEHSMLSNGSYEEDPDSPSNQSMKKKRRRYEEQPSDDPVFEKSRKNAIIAKRNREKKKQMMEQMETNCEHLTARNQQLDTDNGKLRSRVQTLEEEVYYLKSVLVNQSALAHVLSTLDVPMTGGSDEQVRFSTSFEASKYSNGKKGGASTSRQVLPSSGGICLHVDGSQVSMEMCAKCAQMARGAPRSMESSDSQFTKLASSSSYKR